MTDKPDFRPEAVLTSPEKTALVDNIKDAMFDRVIEAWVGYLAAAELRDRAFPHIPGPQTAVMTQRNRIESNHPGYADLVETRERQIAGADTEVEKDASIEAARRHEINLEPCGCRICKGAR